MILLDTNIVLLMLGNRLAEPLLPGAYAVSVVTEMELLSYPNISDAEEESVRGFLSEVTVLDLTPHVKGVAIRPRREHRLRLPDAIIAATAVTERCELLTNDTAFAQIPRLSTRALRLR